MKILMAKTKILHNPSKKKTKIVCTIGPASQSPTALSALIRAGMDVCRINCAHGNYEQYARIIRTVRRLSKNRMPVLLDVKGHEIRIVGLDAAVDVRAGARIILVDVPPKTLVKDKENVKHVAISYKNLGDDVKTGQKILLDDGRLGFQVVKKIPDGLECRVLNPGRIRPNCSVNVPGAFLSNFSPAAMRKFWKDVEFAKKLKVDFLGLSFVRSASDIKAVKKRLAGSGIGIISKIESKEGIENFDEILAESYGIMVARGDLGVELPPEDVPILQKKIIKACNIASKPVITATQMLDSMIHNPRPTRAETSDVANAILDGTDAVMLSGESAIGLYPVEAVRTLYRIIVKTEQVLEGNINVKIEGSGDAVSKAAYDASIKLPITKILTLTHSGHTARMIARFRPKVPIIAVTSSERVNRQLQLVWGVCPVRQHHRSKCTDERIYYSVKTAIEAGLLNSNDFVVVTAGVTFGEKMVTNLLQIRDVRDILKRKA